MQDPDRRAVGPAIAVGIAQQHVALPASRYVDMAIWIQREDTTRVLQPGREGGNGETGRQADLRQALRRGLRGL